MAEKYVQVVEGEWTDESWEKNHDQCCDCGLVHEIDYRIVNGVLQSKVRVLQRNTDQIRRINGIRVIRKKQ